MDQSLLQKVVGMLRGAQAPQAAFNPAYTQYAREATAQGQQPLSPQQFALQQQQAAIPQQPPVAAQPPTEPPQPFRF